MYEYGSQYFNNIKYLKPQKIVIDTNKWSKKLHKKIILPKIKIKSFLKID